MFEIDTSSPVMVTGATGYVAGWIVKRLLEAGVTVHAAVRDPSNKAKLKYLDEIAADAPGEIVYFEADLLKKGSYAEAMKGCRIVFHTASPFTLGVEDPQRDLVDPALLGTRNVLDSVNETESVERVVLTSSIVAIFGDTADIPEFPNGVADESTWNTTSTLDHQPYSYSKTVAEKEAWKIAEAQSRWDMVTINPTLVIGPGINPRSTSESFNIWKQFGDGRLKMGAPDLYMGCVDVREVAQAHIAAAFTKEAKGRHLINARDTGFLEIAGILREKFGKAYPFPKRKMTNWLVWLVAPLIEKSVKRRYLSRNLGFPSKTDNSKSRRELGIEYRPLAESATEYFQQMIDAGVFSKR